MALSVYKVEMLRLQSFPIQKVLEYISNSETDGKFMNISKWCHVLYVVYTGLFDIPMLVLRLHHPHYVGPGSTVQLKPADIKL